MILKREREKEKKNAPICQVKGLQINADSLKIDFSNLYSHFVPLESLQENQYYNFTLKTFCSNVKGLAAQGRLFLARLRQGAEP